MINPFELIPNLFWILFFVCVSNGKQLDGQTLNIYESMARLQNENEFTVHTWISIVCCHIAW